MLVTYTFITMDGTHSYSAKRLAEAYRAFERDHGSAPIVSILFN